VVVGAEAVVVVVGAEVVVVATGAAVVVEAAVVAGAADVAGASVDVEAGVVDVVVVANESSEPFEHDDVRTITVIRTAVSADGLVTRRRDNRSIIG